MFIEKVLELEPFSFNKLFINTIFIGDKDLGEYHGSFTEKK